MKQLAGEWKFFTITIKPTAGERRIRTYLVWKLIFFPMSKNRSDRWVALNWNCWPMKMESKMPFSESALWNLDINYPDIACTHLLYKRQLCLICSNLSSWLEKVNRLNKFYPMSSGSSDLIWFSVNCSQSWCLYFMKYLCSRYICGWPIGHSNVVNEDNAEYYLGPVVGEVLTRWSDIFGL